MARNLDLVALRAVVTVAECGSVTRGADALNLTQSAVSMQIKRLEENLNRTLFDRSQRRMALSAAGETLVDYAKRMLRLNDEALQALGAAEHVDEIALGLPHDIVAPHIPEILRLMAAAWPQVRLSLVVDYSKNLLQRFASGELDIILTTETKPGPMGMVLAHRPLVWLGVAGSGLRDGQPLRVALGKSCIFRPLALDVLHRAGIEPAEVLDGDSDSVIDATVAAGMAITARLEGATIPGCTRLGAEAGLPDLGHSLICIYKRSDKDNPAFDTLYAELSRCYGT